MTPQRTLDVIRDALQAFCAEGMTGEPEHDARVMQWYTKDAWAWVTVLPPRFGQDARGRRDTRAMRYRFGLRDPKGLVPSRFLCEQLAKDALDRNGQPVNWRDDARTFLLQLGVGLPDSPAGIEDAPPLAPEDDDSDGA